MSLQSFAVVSFQKDKLSVKERGIRLDELIWELEKQTGYDFVFNSQLLAQYKNLDVNLEGSIGEILNSILSDKGLTYELDNGIYIIKKVEEKANTKQAGQQSQTRTIKGVVTDGNGVTLPGVSVVVKGTTIGVATNINGRYELDVPADAKIIVLSFIGMETKEIKISGKSNIDVQLLAESADIDEVVVTGYQKIDRKLFTGAATRVEMNDIKLGGEADITKSLEGRVAGVSVQNVSSTFGAAPKIRIRGSSSINGSQKPLWVVDGIVLEDGKDVSMDDLVSGNINTLISSGVAGLNMDDVANIQILSDGSATAIYGARAMNGVILITTKTGKKGSLNVNYSNTTTFRPRPAYKDYNILNSVDQMSINRELYEKGWINVARTQTAPNHGAYGKMFDLVKENELYWSENSEQLNAFLGQYETANTNWFKELFNTGIQQQHTVSISGGSEKADFYTSLGYFNDAGWTIADKVDRYTVLLKGTFRITEKFSVTSQADLSYRNQELSGVNNSGGSNDSGGVDRYTGKISRNFDNNPFLYAMTTSRNIRAYDENGDLEFFRRNLVDYNIIDELNKNKLGVNVRDMSFKALFDYKFNSVLSMNARLSARYFHAETTHKVNENSNEANAYRAGTRPGDSELIMNSNSLLYTRPDETTGIRYSVLPEGGIYRNYTDKMANYYLNASISWNPKIGNEHRFTTMLGTEVRYIDRGNTSFDGFGHFYEMGNLSKPSPNYLEKLSMDGRSYFNVSNSYERFTATMLNAGYSYLGRYTLNGTFRYEGSNMLGKSRSARWMPSWSISGKWALQEEIFLSSKAWLNQLNLRLGYSLVAERGPASNATVMARSNTTYRPMHPESSELAINIAALENSDLTWEKQYELNVGADLSVLDNRLTIDANYYSRDAFDLISRYRSNAVGGSSFKIGNVADMKTKGVELAISGFPIRNDDFSWNSSFTYAYNKSEITNLLSTAWVGAASSIYGTPVQGGPIRGVYSSRFAELDDTGVPMFYDRNNDKVHYLNVQTTDYSDFEYSGNLEPTTNAGFSNTFRYKGFTLSTLITGQFGHVKRVMQNFSYRYNDSEALTEHLKNRWRVSGDENTTNIPAILDADFLNRPNSYEIQTAYNLYGMSDYWLADASFVRFKSLKLSYLLPGSILSKLKLQSTTISVQGINLGMLWLADVEKLGGEDPEFVWSGGTSMPISKQYTISLNVGF
ncbi:MAG: SusC/RagA family TonB-linked outer membrane protein [Mangrovibacterium sp.]